MNNEKKPYVAPRLTAVTFRCERGYAASGPLQELDMWLFESDGNEQMENYSTHSGWESSDNHFWGD